MKSERESSRIVNFDVLRILACFMVVVLHVAAWKWDAIDVTRYEWKVFNLYDSAARSSVPLFFMMSGALFLGRKEMISISRVLGRNVLKLVVVFFFWVHILIPNTHLWFLMALTGVYLLIPVLYPLAKYEGGKYLPYACALFFIFGIGIRTLLLIPFQIEQIPKILSTFTYELSGYSGYFLWGYYLSKKDFSKIRTSYLVTALLITIAAAAKIGEIHDTGLGVATGILYSNWSFPVFAESILIYIIFLKLDLKVSAGMQKALQAASKCTLAIYVLHLFVLDRLHFWLGIDTLWINPWLSVPVISIAVFGCGLIIALILNRIPIINKWLV